MNKRNIGQEILAGLKEIKEWQQGKRKLKTTEIKMPEASDVATIRDHFRELHGVMQWPDNF